MKNFDTVRVYNVQVNKSEVFKEILQKNYRQFI